MTRENALFETSDPAADARADADVHYGRLISHEAVKRWLSSLRSATPLPRPRIGD
ncbi:MAG: CopG family transcriptional regulator [Pseudomonadota bacterium]|nr:CopG family transcriptional regulator [Pseudomonadota bacterium]